MEKVDLPVSFKNTKSLPFYSFNFDKFAFYNRKLSDKGAAWDSCRNRCAIDFTAFTEKNMWVFTGEAGHRFPKFLKDIENYFGLRDESKVYEVVNEKGYLIYFCEFWHNLLRFSFLTAVIKCFSNKPYYYTKKNFMDKLIQETIYFSNVQEVTIKFLRGYTEIDYKLPEVITEYLVAWHAGWQDFFSDLPERISLLKKPEGKKT